MSRKFGVVFDDHVAEEVEESLEYGDSRSAVKRNNVTCDVD